MEFLPLLLGLAFIFYVITMLLRRFSSKRHGSLEELRANTKPGFKWPEIGDYCFEVVGESHYQKALRRHAGDHHEEGAAKECVALLIPENHNEYDNQAVRVAVGVDTVGYLSREDARSFRRRLGAKKLTGQITSCNAVIKGGYTCNGERMSYGIWLDLREFS